MPVNRSVLLLMTAGLALVLAIARAVLQSITLDEADTYFWFASRAAGYIWYPFPNNHVLNTMLIWTTTHLFGTSNLTVRAPALLGASLYIVVCYFLCKKITNHFWLQLSILVCLLYNPYILDFMSAARGYSLADAFLLAAIAVPLWRRVTVPVRCALASLGLGLSFGANFSFAFVDFAAFLFLAIWAVRRREEVSLMRIGACCVLPGLAVALALGGYPILHWPKGQLWYGAHSLREMRQSLMQASLYRLNRTFVGAEFYDTMEFLRPILPPLLAILCFCQVVVTRIDGSWMQSSGARTLGRLATAIAGVATISVLLSWLAFRFDHLPLPMGRTGIYFIPLCTLVAGILAAAPSRSLASLWIGRSIGAVFVCLAGYYLCCLRFSYFKEYEWDADVKDVYSVLARLNHSYGVSDVAAGGLYASSLNFYRVISRQETFPEFTAERAHQLSPGKSIYVLHGSYEREFMEKEGLAVIYQGPSTDVVVAVRPGGKIPPVRVEPEVVDRSLWSWLGGG